MQRWTKADNAAEKIFLGLNLVRSTQEHLEEQTACAGAMPPDQILVKHFGADLLFCGP